jgi:epoxyqueuosine reductase
MSPASSPKPDAKSLIRVQASRLGFDAVGVSEACLGESARAGLANFLAAGHHGEMGWMQSRAEQRAAPQTLWPGARSVISLGISYAPQDDPLATLAQPSAGNISVYARGRDYHDVLKGKLKHLAQFVASRFAAEVKVFVDTAPVMEKPLAQQAGLGWQGKHTNLVSRRHGSWLFLGEIYTSLALPPDPPHPDRCGSCHRCLDACPTDAFPAPYRLDARRCISYLTIEHDGPIPAELRGAIGNRIYGCDDCLAACPWNRFAAAGREAKLAARADLLAPDLAELLALDEAGFRARFAGGPIKRIGHRRMRRNLLIAAGNSADPALLPAVEACRADPDPMLAEAANWAAARLATC